MGFNKDHRVLSTCYAPDHPLGHLYTGYISVDFHPSAKCLPALITKEETEDLKARVNS